MLTLSQVSLTRGTKTLFSDISLSIFARQKVGIVGRNGCGKTSLISMILGQLHPDMGELNLQAQVQMSVLAQHIPDSHDSALNFVLGGDEQYQYWNYQLELALKAQNDEKILQCHEHLQNMGAYSKPAQAATILSGLGFSAQEQLQTVGSFSGGWRMRIGLARCLMKPADLYLLDEPTNHLDLEAIIWLERWIRQLPAAVLLISHDRDFLDNTVERILHIENQQCKLYSGNYSYFEKARAEQLLMQQTLYERQQSQIKQMMSFVQKFKAKASKAKQAQSRLKAIERMELVAQAHSDSDFSFDFLDTTPAGHPLIKCAHLTVGYEKDQAIVKDIQWIVQSHDRIAILGPNGQGKSTLIKTLTGEIPPLEGQLLRASGLKIGYFAQHQVESLDMSLSPIQTIQSLELKAKEQDIRNFLGGFNFHGDMATGSIKNFSGGEKARLALAKLVWLRPNLLLLDEPTNHLDLDMRAAIEIALQSFEGALILISHDRHLIQTTVDNFYLIHDKKFQAFDGDLNDYYEWLSNHEKILAQQNPASSNLYKEIKSLQNKIKRCETQISEFENQLKDLAQKLCDVSLYEAERKKDLEKLQTQQRLIQLKLSQVEEEWIECQHLLEDLQ